MFDGPRLEQRVNLSIPVIVVPFINGRPEPDQAMSVVTRDFSTSGCSIVVDHPHVPKEAVLIFKSQGKVVCIRGKSKHLDPMGGGFFSCGFKLYTLLDTSDYPALERLGETL